MGMYTELIFGASFKKETPKDIIETVRYMAGDIEKMPDNYLWKGVRNPLNNASTSFPVQAGVTKMYQDRGQWVLTSRANIKNYDDDIDKFLSLVEPYIDDASGSRGLYAIVIHEDCDNPRLFFKYSED